jgi:hypothetical protein
MSSTGVQQQQAAESPHTAYMNHKVGISFKRHHLFEIHTELKQVYILMTNENMVYSDNLNQFSEI